MKSNNRPGAAQAAFQSYSFVKVNLRWPMLYTESAAGRTLESISAVDFNEAELGDVLNDTPWVSDKLQSAAQVILVPEVQGETPLPSFLVPPEALVVMLELPGMRSDAHEGTMYVAWRYALVAAMHRDCGVQIRLYGHGMLSLRADPDLPACRLAFGVSGSGRLKDLSPRIALDLAALAPRPSSRLMN